MGAVSTLQPNGSSYPTCYTATVQSARNQAEKRAKTEMKYRKIPLSSPTPDIIPDISPPVYKPIYYCVPFAFLFKHQFLIESYRHKQVAFVTHNECSRNVTRNVIECKL